MRLWRMIAAVGMAAFSFVAAPLPAVVTETQCSTTIVDGANLFKGDVAGIEAAAQQLRTLVPNTVIIVRTYPMIKNTLRDTLQSSLSDCSQWRDSAGRQVANSMFFMVSLNSQTTGKRDLAIYVGDTFGPGLVGSGSDTRIRENIMAPRFRQGQFTLGVAEAMRESFRVLSPVSSPTVTRSEPTPEIEIPVYPPITITPDPPREPYDWSWLGTVGKWLLIILVAALVIVAISIFAPMIWGGITDWLAANKLERALLDNAKKLAINIDSLLPRAERLQSSEHPGAAGWTNRLQVMQAELQVAGVEVTKLSAKMDTWMAETAEIAQELDGFDAKVQQVNQMVTTTRGRFSVAATLLQNMITSGWMPNDLSDQLDTIQERLAAVNSNHEAGRNIEAVILLEQADVKISELLPALEALKLRLDTANSKLEDLTKLGTRALADISAGTETITRLSKTYAPASWEKLKGNGAKATALHEDALLQIKTARECLGQRHDLDAAEAAIAQSDKQLREVISQMRSVKTLATSLDDVAMSLPGMVQAALATWQKAVDGELTWDKDVDNSFKSALPEIRKSLQQAEELCQISPLNPIAARDAILAAERLADKAYKDIKGEFDAAEHERRRAQDEAKAAEAEVADAREYLQDHASHVTSDDQSELNAAHKAIKELRQMASNGASPADIIAAAQHVQSIAQRAYSPVRAKVLRIQREREEREAAERQRREREAEADRQAAERRRTEQARRDREERERQQSYSTPSYPNVSIPGNGSGTWGGASTWSGSSSGTNGGSSTW